MTYNTFEELEKIYKDSISDDFSDNNGLWNNYTMYDVAQADRLILQKHTDIRSFYKSSTNSISVYDLYQYKVGTSTDAVYYLSGRTLNSGSGSVQSIGSTTNENWTSSDSTVLNDKVLNGFYGINLTCASGTKSATSILSSNIIDISNFASTDYIIATFPNYPNSSITASTSYLDISSDATGSFADDKTTSIPFTGRVSAITGSSGNYEFKCLISDLNNLTLKNCDLSAITAVRFRITATGSCNFQCASIRAVSADWRNYQLDINTINNKIAKTLPNNFAAFPSTDLLNNNSVFVRSFDKLFTSYDPKILNGSIAAEIELGDVTLSQTGTTGANSNQFAFYFNLNNKKITQMNLGGPSTGVSTTANTNNATAIGSSTLNFASAPGTNFVVGASLAGTNVPTGATISYVTGNQVIMSLPATATISSNTSITATIPTSFNQGYLTSAGQNLETLDNYYINLTQKDLNLLNQSALDAKNQNELMQIINSNKIDYLKINFNWYKNASSSPTSYAGSIEISDSYSGSTALYSFTIPTFTSTAANTSASTSSGSKTLSFSSVPSTFKVGASLSGSSNIPSGTVIANIIGTTTVTMSAAATGTISSGTAITATSGILLNNQKIIFNPILEDDALQIYLYRYNEYNQPKLIYKTDKIYNTLLFSRSRSRIGWSASLIDGDSYINSIKSRGLVYGEYKTRPMRSRTPVKGARLFADYSENIELIKSLSSYNNSVISEDKEKYNNTISTKTYLSANSFVKGIVTNEFYIEDVQDIYINLNLWSPTNELQFVLINSQNKLTHSLIPSYYKTNSWHNVNVYFKSNDFICGNYKLAILLPYTKNETQWWINHLSIKKRLISWEMRSDSSSLINYDSENWIDLENTINKINDGVIFNQKNIDLQFRARAKSHYASIDSVKTLPVYATLGNFVWRDEL